MNIFKGFCEVVGGIAPVAVFVAVVWALGHNPAHDTACDHLSDEVVRWEGIPTESLTARQEARLDKALRTKQDDREALCGEPDQQDY